MRALRLAPLLLTLVAGVARADEVHLVDGGRLEGVVTVVGDEVRVETALGVVSVAAAEVARIERGEGGAVAEYRRRAAAVDHDDVQGWLRLATWAREAGLAAQAMEAVEQVLRVAPDNAEAHQRLGHVQHEGRWVTEAELRLARGEVRYGDRWLTRAEADAVWAELQAQLDARAQARATAQRRAEAEAPPPAPAPEATQSLPVGGWQWSLGYRPWIQPSWTRPRRPGPAPAAPSTPVAPAPSAPRGPTTPGVAGAAGTRVR
jgi:hypothetical protein